MKTPSRPRYFCQSVLLSALLWSVACAPGLAPQPSAPSDATRPAATGTEVGVLETSMGTMAFRFFDDRAPLTVQNFKRLVREGFYDGQNFYRIVQGHVIQAGDGGESGRPTVKGEFGAHPHVTGAVGLARSESPDSGSTEIYICHAPRPHLDGGYAVFGLLVEGFEVLERIGNVEIEEHWEDGVAFHRPKTPVTIERAYLERRPVPATDSGD